MKKKVILSMLAAVFCALNSMTLSAQGVVVYKTDGTKIKVPYTMLDSIATYTYEDDCLHTYTYSISCAKSDYVTSVIVGPEVIEETARLLNAMNSELTFQLVDTLGVTSEYNGNTGEILFWIDLDGNKSNWGTNNKGAMIGYNSTKSEIYWSHYGVEGGDVLNVIFRLENGSGKYVEFVFTIKINDDADDNAEVKEYTVGGVTFKMIRVEAGTFRMGSTSGDSDEQPVHSVTISKDYYIGETEVTQELWTTVMDSSPSDSQFPVEKVSWNDCQTFITKLNSLTGATFRLPTEAEWEFAARGGNKSQGYTYSGSNTIDNVAWYSTGTSGSRVVKTKSPNELGIYDMSGNVNEWCQDTYGSYSSAAVTDPTGASSGSIRVIRGGGWNGPATDCRCTYRGAGDKATVGTARGLRLAM